MSVYAYLFGANSIQSYIMLGGKVSEMVGASELVEEITATNGVLDDALETLELKIPDDCYFSRRGGGTFYLLFENKKKAEELRDLISLIIPSFAPQLSFNHTVHSGSSDYEAISNATAALKNINSQPKKLLPEAGPLVRRAPRTGMPAVDIKPDPDGQMLWIDAAANIKKLKKFSRGSKLAVKYLGNYSDSDDSKVYLFPRNLEKIADSNVSNTNPLFPFSNDNKATDYTTIGIIHADGNGLGEVLQNLANQLKDSKEYAKIFLRLSDAINSATELAAQKAMQCIKDKSVQYKESETFVLPARPLILGGDDVTIIVRGDLALEFTSNYLQAFEETSTKALKDLHSEYSEIPATMTACAGISFIKASQPFYQGYKLAESLCEHAKNRSREVRDKSSNTLIPSSLAFHRVTTTYIDSYDDRVKREMQVKIKENNNDLNYSLTMGAYGVGDYANKLPQYEELEALVSLFARDEMAKGPLRHFQTLLSDNKHEAKRVWERWQSNLRTDNKEEYHLYAGSLLQYEAENKSLPFYQRETDTHKYYSFIGDLYTCLAVQGGKQS